MVDDHHLVGQCLGLLHQMRGEQYADAVCAQSPDDVPDQPSGLRVHAGGGLVEEYQLRPPDEGAGQRKPLPLATGQSLVRHPRDAGEPEHVK
jgi:hypothetical protein